MGCTGSKTSVSYEPVNIVQLHPHKRSNETQEFEMMIKVVLIGDSGVGKTTMLQRLTENSYMEGIPSTVGVDFKVFDLEINARVVKVQLWDTAGQERFRGVTRSYYRNMDVVLFVYALNNAESFERLSFWISDTEPHRREDCEIIVVGCKSDTASDIIAEDIIRLKTIAGPHQHIQVSSKSGDNFSALIKSLGTAAQNILLRKLTETPKKK